MTDPFPTSIVTADSTPLLNDFGRPTGASLAGAVTVPVTQAQAQLAARRVLWVQGGTPQDPVAQQIAPGRLPLRIPLVAGLALFGLALLSMRGIAPTDEWTRLLPGLLIGGVAVGTISPALAAAMVAVLPVERSGISSGINNTFRQLGIAIGIAGLGAIFDHHADAGTAAAITDGLDAVALVAALVALAGAAIAWPLLGRQRATRPDADPKPSADQALKEAA